MYYLHLLLASSKHLNYLQPRQEFWPGQAAVSSSLGHKNKVKIGSTFVINILETLLRYYLLILNSNIIRS